MVKSGLELRSHVEALLGRALEEGRSSWREGRRNDAAGAYDRAADLAARLAETSPTAELERLRKARVLRYREVARRIRGGEAGTPREEPDPPESERRVDACQWIHASTVGFDDIGGLEEAKREVRFTLALARAVVPEGVRVQGWRNILFYGPPGTGKTLLAAATSGALRWAGRCSVFFNVKVSSVLSKYFGESSRMLADLYAAARDASPSVVFLDEFESLTADRDRESSGAERRILSTLLSELDGLAEKGRSDQLVLTIAATNRPWDVDPAVLSRFEKKIFIPLPDDPTRLRILEIHLQGRGLASRVEAAQLVEMTRGMSGREIESFCKAAAASMIRRSNPRLAERLDAEEIRLNCEPISAEDFAAALAGARRQTPAQLLERYSRWKEGE